MVALRAEKTRAEPADRLAEKARALELKDKAKARAAEPLKVKIRVAALAARPEAKEKAVKAAAAEQRPANSTLSPSKQTAVMRANTIFSTMKTQK